MMRGTSECGQWAALARQLLEDRYAPHGRQRGGRKRQLIALEVAGHRGANSRTGSRGHVGAQEHDHTRKPEAPPPACKERAAAALPVFSPWTVAPPAGHAEPRFWLGGNSLSIERCIRIIAQQLHE